jgi:hypothetical protein
MHHAVVQMLQVSDGAFHWRTVAHARLDTLVDNLVQRPEGEAVTEKVCSVFWKHSNSTTEFPASMWSNTTVSPPTPTSVKEKSPDVESLSKAHRIAPAAYAGIGVPVGVAIIAIMDFGILF